MDREFNQPHAKQFTELDMSFDRVPYDWESREEWLQMPFPLEEYQLRIAKVRQEMVKNRLDALLIYGAPGWLNGDVRWISNFITALGSTVVVLPIEGEPMLTTNSIFHSAPMQSFVHQTWIKDVRPAHLPGTVKSPQGIGKHVVSFLQERKLENAHIGLVGEMFFAAPVLEDIRSKLPKAEFVSGSGAYLAAKQIKTPREIAVMEHAGKATAAGLEAAMDLAKPGVSELELSAAAHQAMAGMADWIGHCMIASGPRSGLKHLYPSQRKLEDGDMVFLDMGVHYQGYNTDTARTLCAGMIGKKQREVLQCGLDMFEAVLNAAKPGVRVTDLQDLAQSIAENSGYGEYYWPTGFGHGIGTNVAELPDLHWQSGTVLQAGHVFALEPMIVIHGFGCGVIEDQILITETGARSLTPARRKLW
ncbi:aminopeptidase P family protein [Paenibacillus donghaensis]|uniref:M24 family metallopeptidase n=1 Tax=Paenibacillus donghaensis TaxID=414771 RepID=UPI00188427A3|nr:Xaa-Pro peptidase family protein [Paenibacillus donghaensis]MBE9917904.1 aminopeptidase P family protein [Paenibacillus donghaensis]